MTLRCPHCNGHIEVARAMSEHGPAVVIPATCPHPDCGKRIDDVAAAFSAAAPGFPLLGSGERWRSETCGTCAFFVRHEVQKQAMSITGYIPAWEPEGHCHRSPALHGKDFDFVACAEWRKRDGG